MNLHRERGGGGERARGKMGKIKINTEGELY